MTVPGFLSKFALPMILAGAALLAAETAQRDASMLDLDGRAVNPFADRAAKLHVFIFVKPDCPISNSYAPEIQRLHAKFASQAVAFSLVYPGSDEPPDTLRQHLRDFSYPCGALRDPAHAFANRSQVTVTPEAALYGPDGTLLYHGRIDDRYVDFGQSRPAATQHDLADALTLALAGRPIPPPTAPAIGCFIEDAR